MQTSSFIFCQNYFKITNGEVKITDDVDIVLKNTNWVNNATSSSTDGTVILTGDAAQNNSSIGGTKFFNTRA